MRQSGIFSEPKNRQFWGFCQKKGLLGSLSRPMPFFEGPTKNFAGTERARKNFLNFIKFFINLKNWYATQEGAEKGPCLGGSFGLRNRQKGDFSLSKTLEIAKKWPLWGHFLAPYFSTSIHARFILKLSASFLPRPVRGFFKFLQHIRKSKPGTSLLSAYGLRVNGHFLEPKNDHFCPKS